MQTFYVHPSRIYIFVQHIELQQDIELFIKKSKALSSLKTFAKIILVE